MARRRLPRVLTVVALGAAGCSAPPAPPDAGSDAGHDAGADAGVDAGCFIPSDFPPDASSFERDAVCNCPKTPAIHCYVEGGPRCFSWACYPEAAPDGGYVELPDGGTSCLC